MKENSAQRGILISFDGLDSTGKATQTKRLAEYLQSQGHTVVVLQSPDYTRPSGQALKKILQNKDGQWEKTPWPEKMRLFAHNRAEHLAEVKAALAEGGIIVYDRYVPSSMAFMAIESMDPANQGEFRQEVWRAVEEQEYVQNNMPKEDLSIFLDVPPRISASLLGKRKESNQDDDEYTDHLHIQENLYNEYQVLTASDTNRFIRIPCFRDNQLLPIEEVTDSVIQAVAHRFPLLEIESSR